ncbi:helix-turn-helix transcriptional regulator [Chitinimonas lacunae]|uniref:Helix-turn-helix transcriptional regulator n=1 Tax=Chitinimonas lacunae TaxID=1963018 RepID=A0ABV8MVM6_9NEIS
MDYPIRIPSQLRPILRGFRKQAGLTQAGLAQQLGITQQSYAELEARPEAASFERLYKVLRLLNVELILTTSSPEPENAVTGSTQLPDTSSVADSAAPACEVTRRRGDR